MALFKITEATAFNAGLAQVKGELTIKGITKTVQFDLNKKGETFTGMVEIDRSKFNVKYGSNSFFDSLGDKTIKDIFTLTFSLVTE